MVKKIIFFIVLFTIPLIIFALDANNISKDGKYYIDSNQTNKLNDDSTKTFVNINDNNKITINSEIPIKHIYIIYEIESKNGELITDHEKISLGKDGFLHEYIKLNDPSNYITLKYNESVRISEINIYSDGDVPGNVQIWKRETNTDLMIFSTHADDEQLFFAGLMPTYINKNKKVHVVYLARHDLGSNSMPSRLHEQLDGLWTLGVTDYPTFGLIPDAYSLSLNTAKTQAESAGFTTDDIIKFDVTEIRKYKPKVIVGHDENGEYGHGQHILNTFTLKEAIKKAEDDNYAVENLKSTKIYKVYLHLYDPDNQTIIDYDVPLEKYNGKTAYEISKDGYKKHLSQQYTWFTAWLNGKNNSYTSAKQIKKYNPAYYGLYYSSVGNDINKNDLFENITVEKEKTTTTVSKTTITSASKITKNKKIVNNNNYLLLFIPIIILVIFIIKRKK